MTTQEYIEEWTVSNINYELRSCAHKTALLVLFSEQVKKWHEKYETQLTFDTFTIALHSDDREKQLWFMQCFGDVSEAKWEKELEDYDKTKMKYIKKCKHPFFEDSDLEIQARMCTPPPSCEIVEVEEIVPEHKRMVKRIVCPKGEVDEEPIVHEEQDEAHDQEMLDNNDRLGGVDFEKGVV